MRGPSNEAQFNLQRFRITIQEPAVVDDDIQFTGTVSYGGDSLVVFGGRSRIAMWEADDARDVVEQAGGKRHIDWCYADGRYVVLVGQGAGADYIFPRGVWLEDGQIQGVGNLFFGVTE